MVVVQIAIVYFGMVLNFNKATFLILHCFPIPLVCEEQAHLIAFISDRGFKRKHIKDNHVAYLRVKPLKGHDVMAFTQRSTVIAAGPAQSAHP